MGKKKQIDERALSLPLHPELAELGSSDLLFDTHTHLLSTFSTYREKYAGTASHESVQAFARDFLATQSVTGLVDVWCEAPMVSSQLEVVEAVSQVEGLTYGFVVGVHPNAASNFNDDVARQVEAAFRHERCVGWGEIGLDYHYEFSDRQVQRDVLRTQLRSFRATGLDKAITIHTREADEDIYEILTEELPKEQRLHIHCFTDSPELAQKLLDHFPNCFIGITGVVTFATNANTPRVVRNLARVAPVPKSLDEASKGRSPLRLLLETDAPYMTPTNIRVEGLKSNARLPFSHTAMLPWTAQFVAEQLNAELDATGDPDGARWTVPLVMRVARENARFVYGL